MSSTISYTRKGSGTPVVLIHGIGHRREAFGEVFERLAATYDVIALDLPGHGLSPEPATYTMEETVAELEEFFAELGLDRPHVVGNSLGGLIALELGKRGTVASVTALSPASFWNKPEQVWAAGTLSTLKLMTYSPTPVLKLFASKPLLRRISLQSLYVHPERLTPEEALGDSLNLRRSKAFWAIIKQAPGVKWSGETVVPTTVAWAEKDRVLLPRQAKRAAAALPKSRHVTLPDAGHVSMIDVPELITTIVTEQVEAASLPAVEPAAS